MAFGRYYRFGAQPMHFAANWHGMPPAATRRGNRQLGEANMFESSAPRAKRYPPLTPKAALRRRRDYYALNGTSIPMRPSGPEPVDPGQIAPWQDAYIEELQAQPVGGDDYVSKYTAALNTSVQAAQATQVPPQPSSFLGLSRNETRAAAVAGVGLAAFLLLRKKK